jgi:hypothetical protein
VKKTIPSSSISHFISLVIYPPSSQKQHDGLTSSRSQPQNSKRNLQYFVQGGGGGSASLYYTSKVDAEVDTDAYSASSGSGEVKGGGLASIRGPNGKAAAGGAGGGTIKGGFGLYAFNQGTGYASGGGQVAGYGGGSGQYFPGSNAGKSKDAPEQYENKGFISALDGKSGSTGGGAGAIAFAQGVGRGNLTAPVAGSFAIGNATGMTTAFGYGYGGGSNSEGDAGGEAVVNAFGNGGGGGTAGEAPIAGVGQGMGGQVIFEGIGYGASSAIGGGYIGADPKEPEPYFPAFVIPKFTGKKGVGNTGNLPVPP